MKSLLKVHDVHLPPSLLLRLSGQEKNLIRVRDSQQWAVFWVLEFAPCEERWELVERNSKWAQQREREREPVGTEQRRSVSLHFPISPPAASIRVEPPPPPTLHPPLPVVSQSASSGACDVTVQSNFVWANQGMLPSPKRERERVCWADSNQARESGRRSDGREKTRDNLSAERRTKTSRNVEWETS